MPPRLRFNRQDQQGWTIADGLQRLGEVYPDRMTFVGFPDADRARAAADAQRIHAATRSLRYYEPEPAA